MCLCRQLYWVFQLWLKRLYNIFVFTEVSGPMKSFTTFIIFTKFEVAGGGMSGLNMRETLV